MQFIILFGLCFILGYILFSSTENKYNFEIETHLGDVVYTHNCYFVTHSEFGKKTDPIIYRIYKDKYGKYHFRGYGNGWQYHDNYDYIYREYQKLIN